MVLAALVAAVFLVAPTQALAFEVAKCTAKPNSGSGSSVLGATETRITWEGQADDDEVVAGFSLTLPEGVTYGLDDARVTVLTGDDLMTRENPECAITSDGQTITVTFDEPVEAGAYLRLEVYEVEFPRAGGEMQLTGTYVLEDGAELDMGEFPSMSITGITLAESLSNWLAEQEWVQQWNSNKFLRLFFNPTIIVTSFPVVFKGFLMALAIVAVAFPLAIPIGFLLALLRISRWRILRGLAGLYVNVVRGTPMFLQIYIAYFGLPLAGVNIPNYPLGVIVLAMNSGAYLCEIFRAGIQSIDRGQFEASRSLGMSGAQTMLYVIVPQMVRRVLPTMTSEFILLYKDTSLLAAVGVMEVVMYAKTIVASTGSITPYIVAAFFYLVVTLPLARLVNWLEARLDDGRGGASAGKAKKRREKREKPVEEEAANE